MRSLLFLAGLALAASAPARAQEDPATLRADSLRGSITPERAWWDVAFYDLNVRIQPADSTIRGVNHITYRVRQPGRIMQVDLQVPLAIDSVLQGGRALESRRDGNAWFVTLADPQAAGEQRTVSVYYSGRPHVAKAAPWDGGFVWAVDSLGRGFIATACQGTGASIWWPNKDLQADEPDSQRVAITVPDPLTNVSNGRLRSTTPNGDGTTTWEWFVSQPINNYDVAVNAAHYAHFEDRYAGEEGTLTLNFWPLDIHADTARRQFQQVQPMLACFEHWFGPYPWYADGFQLIETPHLGMEHQSGIAYGNRYKNGYLGRDLSSTGRGLGWDFIIVHEAAHEWWGNSLTTADLADMWVHESFANYAEGLYVECREGKEAGAEYIRGNRKSIRNVAPIIPAAYGRNLEGSGDMYPKGGNMLHTIRQVVGDDDIWRRILRGLNSVYRHSVVTGRQVEEYISWQAGKDLSRIFAQYLTTTTIPTLEYRIEGREFAYRWTGTVPGFDLPLPVRLAGEGYTTLRPTDAWQVTRHALPNPEAFAVHPDYYVTARAAVPAAGAGGAAP
ncbi:MAG: M1 family metallopeptidase [Gemmatimonadota bacterium]|nr:M1 family metallopeptidase [Gemmatimonadota bacterium]